MTSSVGEKRSLEQLYQSTVKEQSAAKRKKLHSSPPIPSGWITEWSGEKGRRIIHAAVMESTTLADDPASLVVQYLRKKDVFGLADLEIAAGKHDGSAENFRVIGELELDRLLGQYGPQAPIPDAVDDFMQLDLSQVFSYQALITHNYDIGSTPLSLPERFMQPDVRLRKMTELYSLYWGPARMTANIADEIARKHNVHIDFFHSREAYGNASSPDDCWIAFPNRVMGRSLTLEKRRALLPAGFEFPRLQEAVYCIFMKYIATGVQIMPAEPSTYTCCLAPDKEMTVGHFGYGMLQVWNYYEDPKDREKPTIGVAPVWRFKTPMSGS